MKICLYDEKAMQSISRQTRTAGYDIVRLKGATDYALATGVVRIIEAILRDENTLLTISSPTQHYGISEVVSAGAILGHSTPRERGAAAEEN